MSFVGFGFQLMGIFIGYIFRPARNALTRMSQAPSMRAPLAAPSSSCTSLRKQPPRIKTGQPAMSVPMRLLLYEPTPSDARLTVIDKNLTERDFCRLHWPCRLDYVDSNIKGATAANATGWPVEVRDGIFISRQPPRIKTGQPAMSAPMRLRLFESRDSDARTTVIDNPLQP
jgi:hypothetical protein